MRKMIVAALSIALIVSLTACGGKPSTVGQPTSNSLQNIQSPSSDNANSDIEKITFPAYDIPNPESIPIIDMVNNTPVFYMSFPLQENWEIKAEKEDETTPTGALYTPLYIYEFNKLIGYIAFSPFVFDIPEDLPKEGAYPYIFPNRVSSQCQWEPFAFVKAIKNGEVGVVDICYMDPNDIANHPGAMPDVAQFNTTGIVAYDMELKVSAAIAFMPDTISKEKAIEIAKKVEILSEENDR